MIRNRNIKKRYAESRLVETTNQTNLKRFGHMRRREKIRITKNIRRAEVEMAIKRGVLQENSSQFLGIQNRTSEELTA